MIASMSALPPLYASTARAWATVAICAELACSVATSSPRALDVAFELVVLGLRVLVALHGLVGRAPGCGHSCFSFGQGVASCARRLSGQQQREREQDEKGTTPRRGGDEDPHERHGR